MDMINENSSGLGIALNESEVLEFEVTPETKVATGKFRVLTLPEKGAPPDDPLIQILFIPVGRVAASLRDGRWDDPEAEVVPFTIDELTSVVRSFEGRAIDGWEFFDRPDDDFERRSKRLSLDWAQGDGGRSHTFTMALDSAHSILELRIWFDHLRVFDRDFNEISVDTFVAGGKRWWDAFFKGDERTRGRGLYLVGGSKN